jgi:hypothetical protein
MEWYEIIGLIMVWFLGLYLRGKVYEFRRGYYKNGSWRNRRKE